jgi:hypothetical protein
VALQNQYLQVVFASGIDTKTEAKYVAENKLLNLENGILTKTGSIGKRNGYTNLAGSTLSFTDSGSTITLSKIEALGSFKEQLLIFGKGYGASYSQAAGLFNSIGKTPQVIVGTQQIVDDNNVQTMADWDCVNDIAIYAWMDSNAGTAAIKYSVIDRTDNTIIINKTNVTTTAGAHSPKVVILDNYAFIIYAISGSTLLRYRRIDLINLRVLQAEQNFPSSNINSTLANQHFDVHKMDSTRFAFAYNRAGGGVTFGIFLGNAPSVTVTQDASSITENADQCISVITDASLNLWVAYYNTSNAIVRYFVRSVVLAAVLAPTSITGATGDIRAVTLAIDPADASKAYVVIGEAGMITGSVTSGDTATEEFVCADHDLQTGMKIRFSSIVSLATSPALSTSTDYFARVTTNDRFTAFTNLYAALNNITADRLDITTSGTATVTPQGSYNGAVAPYYWSWNSRDYTATIGGTVATGSIFINQHLVSKAFVYNDDIFFVGEYVSTEQPTYFIYSAKTGAIQAKMRPGEAQEVRTYSALPKFVDCGSGQWAVPLGVRSKLVTLTETSRLWLQGLYLSTINFESINQYFSEEFIDNLVVQSGILQSYDGAELVEYGFNKFPEYFVAGEKSSTVANTLANGTYSYAAVYEWTDAAGVRHQSAPAFSNSVTIASGPKPVFVALESLPASMTLKTNPNVIISLYRTEANGVIYYRITSISAPTYNDPTVYQITYEDTQPDSAIIGNEVLYTTGGEIENLAPPSPKLIAVNKTRCFIVPSEYPQEIWYSKESTDNTEQPGFSPGFIKTFDLKGKDILGLTVVDDKIIAFKENKIFFFSGDGPNNLGQQDTFTNPDLITSDVGCSEPASITNTAEGCYFKSSKGFYLLTRDLNLEYVGRDVEAFNGEAVTSGTLVSDTNQVRFTLESGTALVYDYFQKQWMTFANHDAADALIYKNAYLFAKQDTVKLLQETANFYKDENITVSLTVETGWIKLNSIQGFQRVRRGIIVGNFRSEHKLKISVAYDYQDYYTDEILWSADDLFDVTLYGSEALFGNDEFFGTNDDETTYQVRFHMPRQKCESVKFKIEDVTISNPGPSMDINHLMLEVAVKDGVYKLNSDKTVG